MNSQGLVIVALGSNLGDARRNIVTAIERLEVFAASGFVQSSVWRSDPVDCPPGSPPFANAVVGFVPKPIEAPESLLEKLKQLEKEFGRQPKKVINEPRLLDLDLIAFGELSRTGPELTLPHPRAHQRRFVLEPLAEIAPDLVLPGQARTVVQLLADLPCDPAVRKFEAAPG